MDQDQLDLRSDPACVRYDSVIDEWDPNWIRVQVVMHDQIGIQPQSAVILRLRGATAEPSSFGNHITVRMQSQPGAQPPIGSLVGMNSQGQVGFGGLPIGIMLGHDSVTQSSMVLIQGAQPPPLAVSRIRPDGNGQLRVERDDFNGIQLSNFQRQPMPILGPEETRLRGLIAADEDYRVFQTLDAIVEQKPEAVVSVVKKPEPRPPVKNRYERILNLFAKDPEKGGA